MVVIDKKSEDYVKPNNYVRSREEVIDFCRAYLARYTEDEPKISKARKRWIVRTARQCHTAEETISAMDAKMEKWFGGGEPVVEEPEPEVVEGN